MRLVQCDQGGLEWNIARLGLPTCSAYHRILTPKKLQYAAGAEAYRAELLASWALGMPLRTTDMGPASIWTARGNDMETDARRWYAFQAGVKVQQVGFILRDDGLTGGSPDGLVGEDGGVEIKCLEAAGHMAALLAPVDDAEWTAQIQGLLMLTRRKWWDLVIFNPALPKIIKRVHPDQKYIEALDAALSRFLRELDAGKRALLKLPGFTPPPGAVMPGPADDGGFASELARRAAGEAA